MPLDISPAKGHYISGLLEGICRTAMLVAVSPLMSSALSAVSPPPGFVTMMLAGLTSRCTRVARFYNLPWTPSTSYAATRLRCR